MPNTITPPIPASLREAIDQQKWQHVPAVIKKSLAAFTGEDRGWWLLKMGQMLRNANQPALALPCFMEAATLLSAAVDQARIQGWLSEVLCDVQQYDKAKIHGEKSIELRDQLSGCHDPKRKVVSFSLYGANPVYCENAILNAQLMPDIYPDWEMWLYHDHTVPWLVLRRLENAGVKLITADSAGASSIPGTFWRFLALTHADCDVVIMRDADSLISEREKILVDEWLASDKPFHVIRDDYGHTDLILAGLWGVRWGLLSGIRAWIDDYLQNTPSLNATHADQYFLAEWVWPRIKKCSCHHSSVFSLPNASWPDSLPVHRFNEHGARQVLGSWQISEYKVNIAGPYTFIITENGEQICQYGMDAGQVFELPRIYRQAIDEGRWHLKILPFKIEVKGS